jgi:lipoprotein-releasing system permease protein
MRNLFFLEKLFNQDNEKGILTFASKFSLISLILGSFALTISLSLLEGFDSTIHTLAKKFDGDYQIDTYNKGQIDISKDILTKLNRFEEIKRYYPIVTNQVLVKSNNDVKTLIIKGVTDDYLFDKFSLKFNSENQLVISKKLASEILNKNNNLAVFSFPDLNNYYNYKINKFEVINVYETGFSDYDDNIAFIKLSKAQEMFYNTESKVNQIELITENASSLFQMNLERTLEYPFVVTSTEQLHADKFIWIEVQKQPIPIVLGLITLVSCFVIVSTLLIMIVKKFKSIGILRAMGLNKSDMLKYFLAFGVKLAFKGATIGCGFGVVLLLFQKYFEFIKIPGDIYFINVLPVEILPFNIIIIYLVSITLTILASIIPAMVSIKLDPISAIKIKN